MSIRSGNNIRFWLEEGGDRTADCSNHNIRDLHANTFKNQYSAAVDKSAASGLKFQLYEMLTLMVQ